MREIKFIAWHKPFKDNEFGTEYKYGNSVISFHDMSPEKYELEQYTGLEDSGNTKIFEGDILMDIDNGYVIGSVEYIEDAASYWCGNDYLSDVASDSQVCGNIHENPELLEVEG